MDYVKLKAEIAVDPLQRGYQAMTAQQVVDSLKVVNRTIQGSVSIRQVLRWSAATDGIQSFKTGSASGNKDKRRISDASLAMLTSPHVAELDVADPEIIQLLAATVSFGILTQAAIDALKARGQTMVSREAELGIPGVTRGDVLRYKKE